MNRVTSDVSLLPLFGVQTRTVAEITDRDVKIVHLGHQGTEEATKNRPRRIKS